MHLGVDLPRSQIVRAAHVVKAQYEALTEADDLEHQPGDCAEDKQTAHRSDNLIVVGEEIEQRQAGNDRRYPDDRTQEGRQPKCQASKTQISAGAAWKRKQRREILAASLSASFRFAAENAENQSVRGEKTEQEEQARDRVQPDFQIEKLVVPQR
jgi:hypothetical protein